VQKRLTDSFLFVACARLLLIEMKTAVVMELVITLNLKPLSLQKIITTRICHVQNCESQIGRTRSQNTTDVSKLGFLSVFLMTFDWILTSPIIISTLGDLTLSSWNGDMLRTPQHIICHNSHSTLW